MIVVYPLLVSNSVSKNAIPGIIKVLENYILVYELDFIMKTVSEGGGHKGQYKIKKGRITVKEAFTPPSGAGPGNKPGIDNDPLKREKLEKEIEMLDKKLDDFEKEIRRQREKEDRLDARQNDKATADEIRQRDREDRLDTRQDDKATADEIRQRDREDRLDARQDDKFEKDAERQDKIDKEKLKNERDRLENEIEKVTQQKKKYELDVKNLEITKKRAEVDKDKWETQKKSTKVDVGPVDMQSIGLHPTYTKVDIQTSDGNTRTELIGIKVVPFFIKSDAELVHMMLYDKQVSKIRKKVIMAGRKTIRKIRSMGDYLWSGVPVFGGGKPSPTGDVRQDVLMQRTVFEKRIFALINRVDLDDKFFQNANRINRLYSQGWCSFIIADDVNKSAAFCMKHMKGMCSIINYSMIYNTLGHLKVYESLEDAKRTASSLFKVSKSEKKIFGESMADVKLAKHQKAIRG